MSYAQCFNNSSVGLCLRVRCDAKRCDAGAAQHSLPLELASSDDLVHKFLSNVNG